jgi:hypothetical protein
MNSLIKFVISRSVFLHQKDFLDSLKLTEDPDFNGAFLTSEDHLIYYNMMNYPNVLVNIASEPLFSIKLCIYLKKKSSLIGQINKQLIALTTHGFIKQWKYSFIERRFLTKPKQNPEPKKLNLSQVKGGFQLLLFGAFMAGVVFLLELLSVRLKMLRTFFDFFH